eukprot:Gb_27293 [translate_table: standard]
MAETSNPSSSPSSSPIRLSEHLPNLLHFTLSLYLQGDSNLSCSLPREFCAHLLENEPANSCFCLRSHEAKSHGDQSSNACGCVCQGHVADAVEEGVPIYPLYKQLASTLYKSITCGTFARKNAPMPGISEDGTLMQKVEEWMKTIINLGSQLTDVLQRAKFKLHVQEPFFTQLRNGKKTVEGRCAIGDYKRILPGDLLLINNCLFLTVQVVNWYGSFYEMLREESLEKVLPSVKTIEEGEQVYRRFYTAEKEKSGGVLAIVVSVAPVQPYIILSDLLSELHLEGVRVLLGLRFTTGIVPDALPPPRSVLMSSFQALNKPNVRCKVC